MHPDGSLTTSTVSRVGIVVAIGGRVSTTRGYAWDPWQTVAWRERLKAGAATFAAAAHATGS